MKTSDPIIIASAMRTPLGNLLGKLKDFSAHELGTAVIKAVINQAKLNPADIHEVIMGCVLSAGQGQAPTRQAALNAGISYNTPCTTVNKVCGSSLKALMFAHDMLLANSTNIALVGGMESMTNAPYLLLKARQGYRLGRNELYDHMMLDGLEDAYDKGRPMGYFAEMCAKELNITRQQQDDYAITSFKRADDAIKNNQFKSEIIPLSLSTKQGVQIIDTDEHPYSVNPEKIPSLSPIFLKEGTVTAGNSSSIADGAAALILMRLSEAKKRSLKPLARIAGIINTAQAPSEFPTAPIEAIKKLIAKLNWNLNEVDLFEINEAFAVVVLAAMQALDIPHEKVNIHGGGCALGHPIGATGARILVTLLSNLHHYQLRRGIATLCIGGGEAIAIAIERDNSNYY